MVHRNGQPTGEKSKKNIGLILDENGHLTSKDEEKAVAFNDIFASDFNINDRSWGAQSSELEDCNWGSRLHRGIYIN